MTSAANDERGGRARACLSNDIGDDQARTVMLTEFQATLGILDRIIRSVACRGPTPMA